MPVDKRENRALFVRHFAFGDVLLTTPFFRTLAREDLTVQIDLYSRLDEVYLPSSGFGQWISMDRVSLDQTLRGGYSKVYWFNYEFDRSLHILDGYALSSGLCLQDRTLSWTVLPDELVRARVLLEGVKRPLVGFLPVCGNPLKSLSQKKTQRLIDLVRERLGATVAVFADRHLDVKDCLNFSNRFDSIRDLAAVISLCDVWLTIDTGPFHLAQALGVPTVGLFGCTLPELLTTRPARLQSVRAESLPCLGCYHRIPRGQEAPPLCARGDQACMEMFSGSTVIHAIVRALEQREDRSLMDRIAEYESYKRSYMTRCAEDPGRIASTYNMRIRQFNRELSLRRRWRRKRKEWWKNVSLDLFGRKQLEPELK